MKAKLAFAIVFAALLSYAGCQEKEGALRTVDVGSRANDNLGLWLSNESLHDEDKRPRINKAVVWVDGTETSIQPKIESHNSKYGWSEIAAFAVPAEAKSAKIQATVESYGKVYTVTRTWTREQAEGSAQGSWKAESESIELLQEQGNGKP